MTLVPTKKTNLNYRKVTGFDSYTTLKSMKCQDCHLPMMIATLDMITESLHLNRSQWYIVVETLLPEWWAVASAADRTSLEAFRRLSITLRFRLTTAAGSDTICSETNENSSNITSVLSPKQDMH